MNQWLKTTNLQSKVIFTLEALFVLLIFILLSSTQLFWDDCLLLEPSVTSQITNPIEFWLPSSIHFKVWPILYTINWVAFKFGNAQVVFIQFLLICFHIINSYLIYGILQKRASTAALWGAVFFLAHPMTVWTLVWNFQFAQVLSVFFILLFLRTLENSKLISLKSNLYSIFVFFLSLTTKSLGALLGIVPVLKQRNETQLQLPKKKKIISAFFILFPILFFLILRQGAQFNFEDQLFQKDWYSTKSESAYKILSDPENKTYFIQLPLQQKELTPNESTNLHNDLEVQNKLTALEVVLFNVIRVSRNFFYYTANAFTPHNFNLIQPMISTFNFETMMGIILLLAAISFSLFYIFKKRSTRLDTFHYGALIVLLFFIPVSGIFFVPHMKHSWSSPHWYYGMSIGFSFIFSVIVEKISEFRIGRYVRLLYILALNFLFIFAMIHVSDKKTALEENLKIIPHSVTLKNLLSSFPQCEK